MKRISEGDPITKALFFGCVAGQIADHDRRQNGRHDT